LTLDEARKSARTLYAEVRSGGDPAASKRAARERRTTVSEVAALYLADLRERAATGAKRGKLSTAAEFERLLRSAILPRIGSLEVPAPNGAIQRQPWTACFGLARTSGSSREELLEGTADPDARSPSGSRSAAAGAA
jgi:hypothetical protein